MNRKEEILDEFRQAARWFSDGWIALFIFFYAFGIRFTFRSAGFLHMDSLGYAILGEQTFKTLSMHYASFPGHPGVVLINAAFYGLLQSFGFNLEFTTIFISVFFGAMAAPLIYLVCIRLGISRIYAVYAGLIMVFFPLEWSLSEYMPVDVEALFFLLAAFYFVQKIDRVSLYFSSFLFMFSIAIKLENIFLLPFYIIVCLIILRHGHREKYKSILITREIILVLLIQVTGLVLLYGTYIPTAKTPFGSPMRIATIQANTLPWQIGDVFDLGLTTFSIIGIILIILGVVRILCIGRYPEEYAFYSRRIALTILCLSIFSILFSASIPLRDYDRYLLTGFSLLIIFMAYGMRLLGDIDRRIPALVMAFLIIYMVYVTLPIVSARHSWAGQKEFAKNLKELVGEDAIIIALDEGGLINYYSNLTIIQPDVNNVETLLKQNRSVYMVSTGMSYRRGRDFIDAGRNRFDYTPVGIFLNEDWHGRVLYRLVFAEFVYRIEYRRV